MNCKPGDLAVIINDTPESNIGRLVHVIKPCSMRFDDDSRFHWRVEAMSGSTLRGMIYEDGKWTGEIDEVEDTNIADADMRPIRPGDISDEEVRDLYAPNDSKVPA